MIKRIWLSAVTILTVLVFFHGVAEAVPKKPRRNIAGGGVFHHHHYGGAHAHSPTHSEITKKKRGNGSAVESHSVTQHPGISEYAPDGRLPQKPGGEPLADSPHAHTRLGVEVGRKGPYRKAREFDNQGNPVRDIEFTDHGRPANHTNPHQHRYTQNRTGGTRSRGGAEPLD